MMALMLEIDSVVSLRMDRQSNLITHTLYWEVLKLVVLLERGVGLLGGLLGLGLGGLAVGLGGF